MGESSLTSTNRKIFHISPGCTGNTSFMKFFQRFLSNNTMAVWRYNGKAIGRDIWQKNYNQNISILTGMSHILFFSDLKLMGWLPHPIGCNIVKQLHKSYPDSIFILTERPLSQWLKSLIYGFGTAEDWNQKAVLSWTDLYFTYHCCVKRYFEQLPEDKNNLITYDIERDDFDRDFLQKFFNISGIQLSGSLPKKEHHADHSFQNKNEQSASVLLDNMCEFWID